MACAIDIGTGNLCGCRLDENNIEVFKLDRDAFYAKSKDNFNAEMAKTAGMPYIDYGNKVYIIGEDAFKFSHITGDTTNYHRPMAKGVLNPGEDDATAMVETLVERVLGEAKTPMEPCVVTCPAPPLDADFDVTFHKAMIKRFLKKLHYNPIPINEALGIIYAEKPEAEEDGKKIPFTGIAISCGSGMINMVLAWRSEPLIELSVARGGDWIDEEVARNTGKPISYVTHYKETALDLTKVDYSNKVEVALEVYYETLLEYALQSFDNECIKSNIEITTELDVIFAGGTSLVPGFIQIATIAIGNTRLGTMAKSIKLAADPLKAPTKGALAYAISLDK